MFTYEVAPVYNLIEEVVLEKMRSIIGWTEPGDGLFNPGGSILLQLIQKFLILLK